MDEELSLRDISDILGQYKILIFGLPLLLAVIAFAAASFFPKTYTSEAVVALNNIAAGGTASTVTLDPNLLPSASALVSGYQVAAPRRLAGVWNTDAAKVAAQFGIKADDKSGVISLTARAERPATAQARAEQAVGDFVSYTNGVVTNVLLASYRSRLEQTQFDLQSDRQVVKSLRASLAGTPAVLSGQGVASGRDGAAGAGLDPRFAGNADQAANPAYSYLSVQIAQTEARLAGNGALLAQLQTAVNNPGQLIALARQTTQLNQLADPNLANKPDGVGRGTLTILALLLGALLAVLIAFVSHALRRPATPTPAPRRALTPESDLR